MHFWAFIGSLLLASGVAMGAYGAHGLRAIVDVPRSIEAYEYAVQYQLISALGFFAIAWATKHFKPILVHLSGLLLLIGTTGFSLSIYLLVLAQWRPWPLITPISGGFMIAAWLLMAAACLTSQPKHSSFY